MNLIAPLLPPENVVLDLAVSSKKRLFEQIGLIFENHGRLALAQVFDSLFAREKLGSTGLGCGVAIPHGRMKGMRDTLCVFIRTAEPLPFEAPDGQPVRLVLSMLAPEHASEKHLQILSQLAQMFSDERFRQALLEASDATSAHRLLTEWTPFSRHDDAAPVRSASL